MQQYKRHYSNIIMTDAESLGYYFKNINEVSTNVSREEMHELWKRAKRGDRRAKKRIMELNLRLVIPIARKHNRNNADLMDLIEEGNIGLLHAIDKFEPKKGFRFSTYATYWIEQYIRRSTEKHVGPIRIPRHALENLRIWLKTWQTLTNEYNREPTLKEMSDYLNWSAKQIKTVTDTSEILKGIGSLATPIVDGDDSLTLEDTVMDSITNSPDHTLSSKHMNTDLQEAFSKLSEREQIVLRERHGLNGEDPKTLEEIAKMFSLSRERVRQLEERAIIKLRKIVVDMGLMEANEITVRKAPNIHSGTLKEKRKTNILGQEVGKSFIEKLIEDEIKKRAGGKTAKKEAAPKKAAKTTLKALAKSTAKKTAVKAKPKTKGGK